MKNDGISVVAIVIVLLLMSTLGFVFSSLIITKQKSAHLPFRSAQAFYAAQAGIEYAIRYACDNQSNFWADPANIFPLTKNLGAESFTVTYNADESITSTGTAGTAEREITLASFSTYVTGGEITLDPENSPWQDSDPAQQKNIWIPTMNYSGDNIYIFRIDLAKEGGNTARLNEIRFGDSVVWTGKKVDVSTNPDSPTPFLFNQVPYYTMFTGEGLNAIELQSTAEVEEIWWYLTFHYSRQTDLSDPEASTMKFFVTLR